MAATVTRTSKSSASTTAAPTRLPRARPASRATAVAVGVAVGEATPAVHRSIRVRRRNSYDEDVHPARAARQHPAGTLESGDGLRIQRAAGALHPAGSDLLGRVHRAAVLRLHRHQARAED